MLYITHTKFEAKDMAENMTEIYEKELLFSHDGVLFYRDMPICLSRSLNGKKHFAIDEDRRGLTRGKLSYAIAYKPDFHLVDWSSNPRSQRFTNDSVFLLITKYRRYLKPDSDVILFNDAFFEAPVSVLKEIALDVHIPRDEVEYYMSLTK